MLSKLGYIGRKAKTLSDSTSILSINLDEMLDHLLLSL